MPTRKSRVYIGVGGWNYAPWRGTFYPQDLPQARELEYASRQLSSIEINSTFYGSQKPASFIKWRETAPPGFIFAVKAPRYATYRRTLAEAGESIDRFFASGVLELGDKLGPINWQLPPTRQFDADDMQRFLALLPQKFGARQLRHAIEVRHPSFATPAFIELAQRHAVAIVLAGDSEFPRIEEHTAPFVYARIMGTGPRPRTGYASAALNAWADRIRAWSSEPGIETVYLYVISGHKAHNPAAASALLERLRG